jgi:c-di-GMP-binding flagellar brake protein YcgR
VPISVQPRSAPAVSAAQADGGYQVRVRAEIADLLRQLVEGEVPVTLSSRSGVSLVTALWTEDQSGGLLVFSADPAKPEVQALLLTDDIEAVAYLDNVKLQFEVDGLVLVHGRNASAFNARYPNSLYRFQKRDSFRVRPLDHTSPTVHWIHPHDAAQSQRLRVLDISHGGIAILWNADAPCPPHGTVLAAIELDIDLSTRVHCAIKVVHVGQRGELGVRLGCELFDVSPEDARALQRYIDHTQKRRRMLVL